MKLVIFDIDGTLTDTVLLHQKAFTQSLTQLGVQEIDTNYNEYLHHTNSYIAKGIFEKYLVQDPLRVYKRWGTTVQIAMSSI
mgnify:CR=1 FL=1